MTDDVTPPVEGQGGDGGATPTSWIDGLGEDLKGYVENKGWKEPTDVLSSYQNLEKLRGVPEDKLLKLPDDPSQEGAMDSVWQTLGRPDSPDAYTNVLGDGFSDDVFKKVAEAAHKAGVSDSQFKTLQETMGALSQAVLEQQETEAATRFDEWKSKNADGFNGVAKLMAEIGVSEESLAGILSGDKASLYDFLATVGARAGEAPVVQGDPPGQEFGMSPSQAKAKISELMADDAFMRAYTSPNQGVRQPAISRLEALHKAAAKGAAA